MTGLNAKGATVCFVLGVSLILSVTTAHAGDGWPLRHGDFSRRTHLIRQAIRPDWSQHRWPGNKVFREDRDPRETALKDRWRPGVLNLQATNPAPAKPAAVWQFVWLLPGEYTFRLQGRTEDGTTLVVTASEWDLRAAATGTDRATYSGAEWVDMAVNFSLEEAGDVTIYVGTEATGNAKVRDARIDVRKVKSAPVPLADGRVLGAIVLAKDPTEAERYAAWELQKFIFRMTGKAPGVAGRDATAEGVRIYLGGAADDQARLRLDGLNEDGYVVEHRGDALFLAGTNDRGTLYAAYDFLKQQGCGWYWPGLSGEIVPERSALQMPSELRVESPDWLLRGMDNKRHDWDASSWRTINLDDYIDWLVRNRQNSLLASQSRTIDFGKWRGGSFNVYTNHTIMLFWLKEGEPIKMEWSPLVNGKREPKHLSGGQRNSPCTSNQDLRDHTVDVILRFFEQNPEFKVFGLNVDDNIQYWCECEHCRAQDTDEGKGEWKLGDWGRVPFPMTDRWLTYVNEVAARVAEVYPDKMIETYAYGEVSPPPERERVHPNVMVRIMLFPAISPYGRPLRDHSYVTNAELDRDLAVWRQAGAQNMCLYDYDNYRYEDSVFTLFYRMTDSMRTFHNDWRVRNYLAEQHHLISAASYMGYNLRARLLWDVDADYREVIREVCDQLYGPVADTVDEYYRHMDQVVLDYWRKPFGPTGVTRPVQYEYYPRIRRHSTTALQVRAVQAFEEYSFADMAAGQAMLDKAWEAAGDDATLRARLAPLRFGHAIRTIVMAMTTDVVEERKLTREDERQAQTAWQLARDLRAKYGILGSRGLNHLLASFYIAPSVQRELFAFPVAWQFKKDPEDQGLKENWHQAVPDNSWADIRTDSSWTDQGHDYHGVAWYSVEFSLPNDVRAALQKAAKAAEADAEFLIVGGPGPALHFGAVDGFADIFLDGKKIGEQKKAPGMMWNEPFAIRLSREVSQAFAREGKHRLAVRVTKESHSAGIWKPLRIVVLAD